MNKELLKKSLDVLKLVKSEQHNDIDSKTEDELNMVINQIETELKEGGNRIKPKDVIHILSKCVILFKGVMSLIESFSDFLE